MTASCPAIAADKSSTEVKSTTFTQAPVGNDLELRLSTVTLNLRSSNASSTRAPTFPLAYQLVNLNNMTFWIIPLPRQEPHSWLRVTFLFGRFIWSQVFDEKRKLGRGSSKWWAIITEVDLPFNIYPLGGLERDRLHRRSRMDIRLYSYSRLYKTTETAYLRIPLQKYLGLERKAWLDRVWWNHKGCPPFLIGALYKKSRPPMQSCHGIFGSPLRILFRYMFRCTLPCQLGREQ